MRPAPIRIFLTLAAIALTAGCNLGPSAPDYSDYQLWSQKSANAKAAGQLADFLRRERVDQVIPLHQLLRNDVKWKRCGAEPFSVPPRTLWPHMVPTLEVIRDEVIPLLGPIEALSVFRTDQINRCIGGASKSYHMRFYAIDMRPTANVSRAELVSMLCDLHRRKGRSLGLGLGIYGGTRFHIDTVSFRTWGIDYKKRTSPCPSIVALQQDLR